MGFDNENTAMHACLPAIELNDDLAVAVVIDFFELADVAWCEYIQSVDVAED